MIVSLIILVALANIELLMIIILLSGDKSKSTDCKNQSVEDLCNNLQDDYEINEYDLSCEEDEFEDY